MHPFEPPNGPVYSVKPCVSHFTILDGPRHRDYKTRRPIDTSIQNAVLVKAISAVFFADSAPLISVNRLRFHTFHFGAKLKLRFLRWPNLQHILREGDGGTFRNKKGPPSNCLVRLLRWRGSDSVLLQL